MDIQSVAHYQVMIPVYYAICFFVGMTLMPYSPFEILHLSAAFVFLGTCYTAVKNLIFPTEVLLFSLSAACLVAATATGYVGYSVVYTGSLLLAVFLENMFTSIGFMLLAFVNLMWVVCIGLAASCITHISIDYRFGLVAVFFLGSASAIALALRFFDYWFRAEPNESEWRP